MALLKFFENKPVLFLLFRVLVGFSFLTHGLNKLFGIFGGSAVDLGSLLGLAGIIETVTGIVLILGLFVRLFALIAGAEMIAALFIAHFENGIIPLTNGGEPAFLFLTSFLVLLMYGAGKWSLERAIFNKETF